MRGLLDLALCVPGLVLAALLNAVDPECNGVEQSDVPSEPEVWYAVQWRQDGPWLLLMRDLPVQYLLCQTRDEAEREAAGMKGVETRVVEVELVIKEPGP